jgi:roadblock/LC7 domain-containing protein
MFKASLDNLAKYLPFVLVGFVLLIFITIGVTIENGSIFVALLPALPICIITIGAYYYSPLYYEVEMDSIAIVRKAGKFFIARKDIKALSAISEAELGRAWRMMGNGGVFGYTGYYSSSNIGKMRWFVSQRKNYVLITMNNDSKFLLSPDDVAGFLAATQS